MRLLKRDAQSRLKQIQELSDQFELTKTDKQAAIDTVLTDEQKVRLAEIDVEFDEMLEAISQTKLVLMEQVRDIVIAHGETVKYSDRTAAIFVRGQTRWNTKKLDILTVNHPEIEDCRIVSASYVRVKG